MKQANRHGYALSCPRQMARTAGLGVPYLANPDPPEHLRTNAPLNKPVNTTFNGGVPRSTQLPDAI